MSEIAKMVFDDPEKMHILTDDMKKNVIKAATATVNIKAALARKEAIKTVKEDFTLRNNFTTSQIQFTPMAESPYIKLDAIKASVGVTEKAAYMARQETGGEHTPAKGKTLAIATDVARGGSPRNPIAPTMRVGKISKKRRVHGKSKKEYKSKKAFNVARAFVAFAKGLFLPWGGAGDQRNLHQVVSFEKTSSKVEFKTEQTYKFDMEKTKTKAQPWLLPACEKVEADSQDIFNSQMKKLGM